MNLPLDPARYQCKEQILVWFFQGDYLVVAYLSKSWDLFMAESRIIYPVSGILSDNVGNIPIYSFIQKIQEYSVSQTFTREQFMIYTVE